MLNHRWTAPIGGSASGYLELFALVGNPNHSGADSGEVLFYASAALGVNFRFCRD